MVTRILHLDMRGRISNSRVYRKYIHLNLSLEYLYDVGYFFSSHFLSIYCICMVGISVSECIFTKWLSNSTIYYMRVRNALNLEWDRKKLCTVVSSDYDKCFHINRLNHESNKRRRGKRQTSATLRTRTPYSNRFILIHSLTLSLSLPLCSGLLNIRSAHWVNLITRIKYINN